MALITWHVLIGQRRVAQCLRRSVGFEVSSIVFIFRVSHFQVGAISNAYAFIIFIGYISFLFQFCTIFIFFFTLLPFLLYVIANLEHSNPFNSVVFFNKLHFFNKNLIHIYIYIYESVYSIMGSISSKVF